MSVARRRGAEKGLKLPLHVLDLHEPQDHVDERDDPEAEGRVHPAGDLLGAAQHPAYVEMLGPEPGHRNAVAVEPGDGCVIDRLIAGRIGDQRPPDPAEAPDDERGEHEHGQDRQRHGDGEREERRDALLKPALKRPHQGDDEERERQRREHRVGEIGAGRRRHDRDDGEPRLSKPSPTSWRPSGRPTPAPTAPASIARTARVAPCRYRDAAPPAMPGDPPASARGERLDR